MKRGEVWTASAGQDYAGKPRPVVILQDDRFGEIGSTTVGIFSSAVLADAPDIRLNFQPGEANGLQRPCQLMIDKITTIPRSKLGKRIGALSGADINRIDQAIMLFFGLIP